MYTTLNEYLVVDNPSPEVRKYLASINLKNKKYDSDIYYSGFSREKPIKEFYKVIYDRKTQTMKYKLPRNIFSFSDLDIKIDKDERNKYPFVFYTFGGKLHEYQQQIADNYLSNPRDCYMVMPCGSGKTYTGIYILSKLRRKTLILTHTEEIMLQWKKSIQTLLNIPVGLYYGKEKTIENVTVGLIQTLHKGMPEGLKNCGVLINDEVHHLSSQTFTESILQLNPQFRIGLTATPERKDNLECIMYYHMGDIQHKITHKQLEKYGVIHIPDVEFKNTDTAIQVPMKNGKVMYTQLVTDLMRDEDRNELILNEIREMYQSREHILVLSDRKEHVDYLIDNLEGLDRSKFYSGIKNRREAVNSKLIIATTEIAREGLDIKSLDGMIITSPMDDPEQPVGRIARSLSGKKQPKCVIMADMPMYIFSKKIQKCRLRLEKIGCNISWKN